MSFEENSALWPAPPSRGRVERWALWFGERDFVIVWALVLGTVALLGATTATLAFAWGLLRTRPVAPGEAEVLFEAARLHDHLPLFIDPQLGAYEYGSYPSRFYVLYPPIWSWVLSHLPSGFTFSLGRFLGTTAWFGVLATLVHGAAPACRRAALAGALFVAGVFVLTIFASTGRPDAIAVGLSALALDRCVRERRASAIAVVLFCVAAVLKPNVSGAMAGVLVIEAWLSPRRALRAWALAALTTGALIAVLELGSGGIWHQHLIRSLGQPLSASAAFRHAIHRLPLFGALIATCGWLAWKGRRAEGTRLAGGALVGAVASACFALSHPGCASNYWLETCATCVVVLAHTPFPAMTLGARRLASLVFAVQAIGSFSASLEGVTESFATSEARGQIAQLARATCLQNTNDVIVSDEPGIELETNGRILATVFTMNSLVRAGKYPLAMAVRDAKRPEIRCVVSAHGDFAAFLPEVRDVFRERFTFAQEGADWRLYVRR